jgi:hypothetical protein
MKFEEALRLMREGKTVVDPHGQLWKLEDGKFKYYMSTDSHSPGWNTTDYLQDLEVMLKGWTVYEPKYIWVYGRTSDFHTHSIHHITEEEAEKERLKYGCDWKHRINETRKER